MKVKLTVEIISIKQALANRIIPKDLKTIIDCMPATERDAKSIIHIEGYEPRLIDNKGIARYYPMAVARTFAEALELISKSDTLVMIRRDLSVVYRARQYLANGNIWSPTPNDILSKEAEWYVHPQNQSYQEKTELTEGW